MDSVCISIPPVAACGVNWGLLAATPNGVYVDWGIFLLIDNAP